jgi:hypothetical protein
MPLPAEMPYTQERNTSFFPEVLKGAIQLMARSRSSVGSVKRRQLAKKLHFLAKMAKTDTGKAEG